jgi:hypothetical protein
MPPSSGKTEAVMNPKSPLAKNAIVAASSSKMPKCPNGIWVNRRFRSCSPIREKTQQVAAFRSGLGKRIHSNALSREVPSKISAELGDRCFRSFVCCGRIVRPWAP